MNQADGIIAAYPPGEGYGIFVGHQLQKPLFTLKAVEHLGQPGIDIRLHLSALSVNQGENLMIQVTVMGHPVSLLVSERDMLLAVMDLAGSI